MLVLIHGSGIFQKLKLLFSNKLFWVAIINNLCSVHTCEICKYEGYADGNFGGKILCDDCHFDLTIERETLNG